MNNIIKSEPRVDTPVDARARHQNIRSDAGASEPPGYAVNDAFEPAIYPILATHWAPIGDVANSLVAQVGTKCARNALWSRKSGRT